MKPVYLKSLLTCLLACVIIGCDDFSQEPKCKNDRLIFDAKGGSQTNDIIVKKIPWIFEGLSEQVFKDGWLVDEPSFYPDDNALEITESETGMITVKYKWATYSFFPSGKEVRVTLEENRSGDTRVIFFYGWGHHHGFGFSAVQPPLAEATDEIR